MANFTKRWYVPLLLMGLLTIASCENVEIEEVELSSLNATRAETFDPEKDLTLGYNVLIWDESEVVKDEAGKVKASLKLNTNKEVTATIKSNQKIDFTFTQELDGEYSYLIPDFTGSVEPGEPLAFEVELKVKDAADSDKTIYVVIREPMPINEATTAQLKGRAAELFGYGVHIWGDMGDHGSGSTLSLEAILPHIKATTSVSQSYIDFDISGSNLVETTKSLSVNVGASLARPSKSGKHSMSASASVNQVENERNKAYFEYYMAFSGANMGEAWIDVNKMKSTSVYAYLDKTLNDVLNNPGSTSYQNYENTDAGITNLLDYYGTDVLTQASFGGYSLGFYARAENVYDHSVTTGVDVTLALKSSGGQPKTKVDKILSYLRQKNGMTPGTSANVGVTSSASDYEEATKSFSYGFIRGGNGEDDQDLWKITDNPKNWIIISYKIKNGDVNTSMPIEEFVYNKESNRYKELRRMLGNGDADESPYFQSKNLFSTPEDSRLIVADFMMLQGKNGHKDGDPAPKIMEGPDKVKRIYYPLMANENFPTKKEAGYAAETSSKYFITATDDVDHYWYYALDHADACNGIIDVKISNKNQTGYVQRGDHADTGITGSIDNNYIWLKCGDDETQDTMKITGFALLDIDNEMKAFASTGGTEMESTWTDKAKEYFNNYWSTGNFTSIDTRFYSSGLVRDHRVTVGYTTKEIKRHYMKHGVGDDKVSKICHPKKWGE